MSKTLIIITRYINEYDDSFWAFGDEPITHKEIAEDYKAIVIKRARQDDLFADYCNDIVSELTENPPDEIGIIIHLLNGNDEANCIREGLPEQIRARLRFCKWYSSTLDGFWDGTSDENDLPYNAFRVALHSDSGQLAAFNRLWNYFLCDPVLEAKLELLHNILDDEDPNEAILALLRKKIASFDEFFRDFKDASGNDIFSVEYQYAFETFRNSLDLE